MTAIFTETIPDGANDGHEQDETSWDALNSTSLSNAGNLGANSFHTGWRFTTVPVPTGTTQLNSAELIAEVSAIAGTPDVEVFADVAVDADAWTTTRPSEMNLSTGVPITPSVSTTFTIDVTALVEAILALAWVINGAMRFAIMDQGGVGNNCAYFIDITTWGSQNFATLDIDYIEGAGGSLLLPSLLRRRFSRLRRM